MAILKAFKGIRPVSDKAKDVASRPYDVLDSSEARAEACGCPLSFLHVVKPEIDLPEDADPYGPEVYKKGLENFQSLLNQGVLEKDERESLYIYRLTMNGRSQSGWVGLAAVDDYFNEVIKKHELTRPVKEEDRMNHIRVSKMNAEPVFFTYRKDEELDRLLTELSSVSAEIDFTADDGIRHEMWSVTNAEIISKVIGGFSRLEATYVADGHHRTAAAAKVGRELRDANPNHQGSEDYNYFLAVHFPAEQLSIIDYNRVVKDLNGWSEEDFLNQLKANFSVTPHGGGPYHPERGHAFGMYLGGNWYKLHAKDSTYDENDPIRSLDVSVLSETILDPLLGIRDLRNDKRIDFVGGIRGLEELERRVDSGEMKVAFALYPVSMEQLMTIADTGNIMPPKTTWFEPKLRSGLIVHQFAD